MLIHLSLGELIDLKLVSSMKIIFVNKGKHVYLLTGWDGRTRKYLAPGVHVPVDQAQRVSYALTYNPGQKG